MAQDKPKTCPKCKKRKAKRLLGKGNFILKGPGFYNTSYRNGDNPPKTENKK